MRRVAVFVILTFAACDRGKGDLRQRPVVADSSGVRIVQYGPSELRDADVELRELLRIGAVEGAAELLFSNIAGGLFLLDTSVVLADRGSREVRRFDRDGSFIGSHGREGQGPREYRYIRGEERDAMDVPVAVLYQLVRPQ